MPTKNPLRSVDCCRRGYSGGGGGLFVNELIYIPPSLGSPEFQKIVRTESKQAVVHLLLVRESEENEEQGDHVTILYNS